MNKAERSKLKDTQKGKKHYHISHNKQSYYNFSLTVKAATLIFISGRGSAISSAKQGKSGSIYILMKNE